MITNQKLYIDHITVNLIIILNLTTRMIDLEIPFSMIVAGPSGCGKSTFIEKLVCLFLKRNTFKHIHWYNNDARAIPKQIQSINLVEVHNEIPQSFGHIEDNSLIILDDMMLEAYNKAVCGLFVRKSHHHNISVILTSQNVFHQNKLSRDISLNSKYLVFFKNPRDKSQMLPLSRQIFPENPMELYRVYKEVSAMPHGYLLFDLTQSTPDILRFRTDIFNDQFSTCYSPSHLLDQYQSDHETFEGAKTYATCVKKF